MELGEVVFRSGRAAIAEYYRPKFASAVPTIGRPDDSFIAFPYLFDENDAQLVRDHLAPSTELAAYLSHWHFDPPKIIRQIRNSHGRRFSSMTSAMSMMILGPMPVSLRDTSADLFTGSQKLTALRRDSSRSSRPAPSPGP